MIESKAFEEMNSTYPIEPDAEPYSPSLHPPGAAASASAGSGGFLQKLKGKFKRQVSSINIASMVGIQFSYHPVSGRKGNSVILCK